MEEVAVVQNCDRQANPETILKVEQELVSELLGKYASFFVVLLS